MGQDPLAPPTVEGTTNASVSPAAPQLHAPEAVPARMPWVSPGGSRVLLASTGRVTQQEREALCTGAE